MANVEATRARRPPLSRAQTLPRDWVAQPLLGGERNGTKWELNRVYDPAGHLVHEWTYWEVRQVLADDPAPRSVEYEAIAPTGVAFGDFTRLTTPLAEVERWIAMKAKAASTQTATRATQQPATVPGGALSPA